MRWDGGGLRAALLAAVVLTLTATTASAEEILWLRQLAGSGQGGQPAGVGLDAAGNVFVAGTIEGGLRETSTIEPSFGTASTDTSHGFLRKYDAVGNILWTRTLESSLNRLGIGAMAVAPDGDTVVVGRLDGALPGQSPGPGENAFIRRYDPNGDERWTHQFGVTGNAGAGGVAFVGGDLIVMGTLRLPPEDHSADVFLQRYTGAGALVWTRQLGTAGVDVAYDMGADASGVTIVGTTDGLFPGAVARGDADRFLVRVTQDGEVSWIRQFGTEDFIAVPAVTVDAAGAAYVTDNNYGVTSAVEWRLAKYLHDGTFAWEMTYGSPGRDETAWDVATDASGVYVTGRIGDPILGTPEPPPGPGDEPTSGAFVTRLTFDGIESWTTVFTAGENIEPRADTSGRRIGAGDGELGVAGVGPLFVGKMSSGTSCADTSAPDAEETGPVSGPVHRVVEPITGPAGPAIHEVNCFVVAPLGL